MARNTTYLPTGGLTSAPGSAEGRPGESALPVGEGWIELAADFTAADLAHLEMREWYGKGYLWGFCRACDCVMDPTHLQGKRHKKAIAWLSIAQGACQPCAESPSNSAVRPSAVPATRTTSNVAETPGDASVSPASSRQGSGVAKKFHAELIKPSKWNGEAIRGAFLMDSFYKLKNSQGSVDFIAAYLQDYWERTGKVVVAACSGGAALVRPCGTGARFADLLAMVPADLEFIIAVVCGNDFFDRGGWHFSRYDVKWEEAATELCNGMKLKAQRPLGVVCASARTWGFE